MTLSQRQNRILRLVVEAYIATGRAVSSSGVVERFAGARPSAATVRADMAKLEDLQLLRKPHTSAGRVPTRAGLRSYLDQGMQTRMHPWDRHHLETAIMGTAQPTLARDLGQSLASLSGQIAVLGVPRFAGMRVTDVGLTLVARRRLFVQLVCDHATVHQKTVDVDFDLGIVLLEQVQNYLRQHLCGRTLLEARKLIGDRLKQHEAARQSLKITALEIGYRSLPEETLEIVVEGTSEIAMHPEFADRERLGALLKTLEAKGSLLKLLHRLLDDQGVRVFLGSEGEISEITDLACVGGAWVSPSGETSAAVTLLGTNRMDYGRLVPMVGFAMQLFSRHWTTARRA